jgi:hypothetical protein
VSSLAALAVHVRVDMAHGVLTSPLGAHPHLHRHPIPPHARARSLSLSLSHPTHVRIAPTLQSKKKSKKSSKKVPAAGAPAVVAAASADQKRYVFSCPATTCRTVVALAILHAAPMLREIQAVVQIVMVAWHAWLCQVCVRGCVCAGTCVRVLAIYVVLTCHTLSHVQGQEAAGG